MLKAWNTGHPGGAATVHANDALSGLIRMESLVAEATCAPQQTLIAEAIDLVVFVDQEPACRPAARSGKWRSLPDTGMAVMKSSMSEKSRKWRC